MNQFDYNIIEISDLFSNLNDICPYYFPKGYIITLHDLKINFLNGKSLEHFLYYAHVEDKAEVIQLELYLIKCINFKR
jgi:hypothetical protein